MKIYLKYIGNGSAIPGVPAKDLTKKQVENLDIKEAALLSSGLYEKIETKKKSKSSGGKK